MRWVWIAIVGLVGPGQAAEPFRFPETKHGKGELRYVHGLPLLTVEGTPEEIGDQVGVLVVRPLKDLEPQFKAFLKRQGLDRVYPLIVKACTTLISRLPEDHRKELDAMVKASGMDRDMFIVANAMLDILKIGGCSTLIVEPSRSATGELLFGRNFDFWSLDALSRYHVVTVYRPKGKKAFVSVGFPGLIGFPTAMNEDGLCLAVNEIPSAADKSPRFDPEGLPTLVTLRRIMEECSTVAEAEKLVRSMKRTTLLAATICDTKTGEVLEITTRNVIVRHAEKGLCVCTNHFCSKELATETACSRFTALLKGQEMTKLGVDDVAKLMHSANQGKSTLHTVVFEPKSRTLHIALGDGKSPASGNPLQKIDFGPYFAR